MKIARTLILETEPNKDYKFIVELKDVLSNCASFILFVERRDIEPFAVPDGVFTLEQIERAVVAVEAVRERVLGIVQRNIQNEAQGNKFLTGKKMSEAQNSINANLTSIAERFGGLKTYFELMRTFLASVYIPSPDANYNYSCEKCSTILQSCPHYRLEETGA